MSDKKEPKEENKKICFVIMPISDVEGYEKGHFGRVYEHIIKPACEKAGFEAIRADDTSKANVIIVDILQQILKADMAICDISARNANVFYELGFRQAFNKKTVLIRDDRTDMPFDISSIRTVSYNSNLRIDEVYDSVSKIQMALEATEKAEDDTNSLLNLLSFEKATIPNSHKITAETSLVLDAIKELNYKFSEIYKKNDKLVEESKSMCEFNKGDIVIVRRGEERFQSKILATVGNDHFIVWDKEKKEIIVSKNEIAHVLRFKVS